MGEKLINFTAVHMKKVHPHHLNGVRLWLARGSYFFTLLMIVTFFFAGFPVWLETWSQGSIGAYATQNSDGRLIMSVSPKSMASGAGILNGDVLTAINGTAVTTVAQANRAFAGKPGDTVTVTVQTGSAAPRQYSIIISGGFLNLLKQMHLSLQFMGIYNTIFSCLLALVVILCSPLVYFRRSNDWLVILVAFSMISFASSYLYPVYYGAYKLNMVFIYNLVSMIGTASMIIVFFIFPSGRFEPHWMRWVSILLVIPTIAGFLNMQTAGNYLVEFFLWVGFFALGAFAQVYRYRHIATSTERAQTKQLVFGAVTCFSILAIMYIITILIPPYLSSAQTILFSLFISPVNTLPVLILDLSFVLAIYHYRLWDTDLYINRTLVYTAVTLFLVLVWFITAKVLSYISQQFFDKQISWLGALLSSLPAVGIYKPVQKWVEKWANAHFYKERIDYSEALIELKPEMWNFLTATDLGHTLVTIIPALLQSESGALFIMESQGLTLAEAHNLQPSEASNFKFTEETLKKLANATVVNQPEGGLFAMLVPLTVSRFKVNDLVGVLAIGPRTQGRGYSRDHQKDLSDLGRDAGIALHMLKFNEKKQAKEIPSGAEG